MEADTLVLNRTDGDYMISVAELHKKSEPEPFALYGGGDVADVLADADGDASGLLEPMIAPEEDVNTAAAAAQRAFRGSPELYCAGAADG